MRGLSLGILVVARVKRSIHHLAPGGCGVTADTELEPVLTRRADGASIHLLLDPDQCAGGGWKQRSASMPCSR